MQQRAYIPKSCYDDMVRRPRIFTPHSSSLAMRYPWDLEWLDYRGASSHDPLRFEVIESKDQTGGDELPTMGQPSNVQDKKQKEQDEA